LFGQNRQQMSSVCLILRLYRTKSLAICNHSHRQLRQSQSCRMSRTALWTRRDDLRGAVVVETWCDDDVWIVALDGLLVRWPFGDAQIDAEGHSKGLFTFYQGIFF